MYIAEIYKQAVEISGEESERLQTFCRIAAQDFLGKLREGVTVQSCLDTFITASAIMAVAMDESLKAMDGISSYRVGNVSIARNGKVSGSASELKTHAEELMAPYTYDDDFAFLGVRG